MAEGDWTRTSPLAKVVGVGAEERAMSPCVAVHTILVLGARGSEMPDLVTSIAACPGLKVLGAVGTNMPGVAAHGAEVVHVNNWRGGRVHGGVLELRGAGDEVNEHVWGRGANCR